MAAIIVDDLVKIIHSAWINRFMMAATSGLLPKVLHAESGQRYRSKNA